MKQLFRRKSVSQILQEVQTHEADGHGGLHKNLNLNDLVALGIAAIIGTGAFSTIGTASYYGGPAVVFLFIFTAIACLFSALCYAEFASNIPISGSAYTYAYTTFGEIIAWVLGWSLVMEYAIGNIAVAISWSDYFTGLFNGLFQNYGLQIPDYFAMDYLSAWRGYEAFLEAEKKGAVTQSMREAYQAWQQAPTIGGLKIIADLPALLVTFLITSLVYVGIRESKVAGNVMVLIKISVILVVIAVGAFYVKPENWSPFAPNGIGGVLKGVSAVFFAYIGFDAISTTAEECKNPRRDLPKAMIYTLIICTVLYIFLAIILTGMVNYKELQVGDPLAFVFKQNQADFMEGLVAVSAVIAITSVFLVFQLGQPRILMTMSRDGLLPKNFSKIHPKYKTPYYSTVVTGLLVAVPALFMNLREVTDLSSIGTLFAFALVSAGVLLIEQYPESKEEEAKKGKAFKVPYYNGKYLVLAVGLVSLVAAYVFNEKAFIAFFTFQYEPSEEGYLWSFLRSLPMWVFVITSLLMTWFSYRRNLSFIPVMGFLTNLYLITELGIYNWIGFGLWMLLGLGIYFMYGYRHSRLRINKQV